MLIPFNTDAPVYHWPFATVGLIVVNTLIYFATIAQCQTIEDFESISWLILNFQTINPLQWITQAFMHADFMHLLGNMFFLWAFGLVVEGKLGWYRFLMLYMGMTAIDGAVVQIPMFLIGSDGGALGASGVIFALMAIAVVWAPDNELDCILLLGVFTRTIEIRIFMMGGIYIMLQLAFFATGGFRMSSELLHLVGLGIGFPVGFWMLKNHWVDCEGWDLISRYGNTDYRGRPKKLTTDRRHEDPVAMALALDKPQVPRSAAATSAVPVPASLPSAFVAGTSQMESPEPPGKALPVNAGQTVHPSATLNILNQAVDSQNIDAALHYFMQLQRASHLHMVSEPTLIRLAELLSADKRWLDALPALDALSRRTCDHAHPAALRVAQIQLQIQKQPQQAIETLRRMTSPFSETIAGRRQQLYQAARKASATASTTPSKPA